MTWIKSVTTQSLWFVLGTVFAFEIQQRIAATEVVEGTTLVLSNYLVFANTLKCPGIP